MFKDNNKSLLKISPFRQNEACIKSSVLLYVTMAVFQGANVNTIICILVKWNALKT